MTSLAASSAEPILHPGLDRGGVGLIVNFNGNKQKEEKKEWEGKGRKGWKVRGGEL